jgi:hypothetical protein
MKRLFIFILIVQIFFLSNTIFAQTLVTQVKTTSGKWGYINLYGETVIPAMYQKCYPFACDLATVFDDSTGQFQFLRITGEKIKTDITNFTLLDDGVSGLGMIVMSEEMIPVKNDKWGYLNTSGKLVIPQKYDEVNLFHEGYAIVRANGMYFIIDKQGKEIQVNIPGIISLKSFSEGLAVFDLAGGRSGYIDITGRVVIQPIYNGAGNFSEGLAWAKAQNDEVGFIDQKGTWIIKPSFDKGGDFDSISGLARVKSTGFWVYSQRDGKVKYFMNTKNFGEFKNGFAIGEKTGKYGFFNANAEWAIPPQFDAVKDFKNGYAAAKLGDKWGIIDKHGNWVIDPQYLAIKNMEVVAE